MDLCHGVSILKQVFAVSTGCPSRGQPPFSGSGCTSGCMNDCGKPKSSRTLEKKTRRGGVTGSHAGLRILCRKACGFDSRPRQSSLPKHPLAPIRTRPQFAPRSAWRRPAKVPLAPVVVENTKPPACGQRNFAPLKIKAKFKVSAKSENLPPQRTKKMHHHTRPPGNNRPVASFRY